MQLADRWEPIDLFYDEYKQALTPLEATYCEVVRTG